MFETLDINRFLEKSDIFKATEYIDVGNIDVSELDKPIEVSDANNVEEIEYKNLVPKIDTRNSRYEGDNHPHTGIPFERKQVENVSGEKIEGVFPVFESLYDVQLPEVEYQATDNAQFSYCNEKLKEAFENGELDCSKFDERQLEQIENGDKPQGYTWHHNEELGKMELVNSDIHDKTGHTGGKVIWGGGQDAR